MSSQDKVREHLKAFLGDDVRVEELLQMLVSDGVVLKVDSGDSKQSITWCAGYEIAAVEPLIGGE